jgi:peptidoglycan/LPS O-acetylase OafA/YrhL
MLFIIGINLARNRQRIAGVISGLSHPLKVAIALLSALFYVFAIPVWTSEMLHLTHHEMALAADWLTAFGAAGIIMLSLNSNSLRRILLWGPIHNLGKMSYSVYLIHFTILLLFVHLLYNELPLSLIIVIWFFASLAVSWQFYRRVEVPFINLGRKLGAYSQGRSARKTSRICPPAEVVGGGISYPE